MITAWIIISVVVIIGFLRVVRALSSMQAVVVAALGMGLLGPGVIVPGHFALAVPAIIGLAVHFNDRTPFHLFSWNLAVYGASAIVLLIIGVFVQSRRRTRAGGASIEP